MTSKIVVNNIQADAGVSTVTFGSNISGNFVGSISVSGVTTVAAGSTSAPSISPSGDSNTGIFFPSADTIAFAEGGAEAARFDSSGRLGIGTVNPSSRVHVYNGDVSITGPVNSNANLYLFNNAALSNAFRIGQGWSGNDNVGFLLNVANADIVFGTNNAENARLTSAGNIQISNGNLVFSTSGKGIDFSATSNSSGTMTSEVLSDYEEGTWTPVPNGVTVVSGSPTYEGTYTKIGRAVHATMRQTAGVITIAATNSFQGLPFTPANYHNNGSFTCAATGKSGVVNVFTDSRIYIMQLISTGTSLSNLVISVMYTV